MVDTANDGSQTSAVAERTVDAKSSLTPSGIASRLLSTLTPGREAGLLAGVEIRDISSLERTDDDDEDAFDEHDTDK